MEEKDIFSEEDYKEMLADGVTEDEIEILRNAVAATQTIDLLPGDATETIKKIQELPDDTKEGFAKVLELSQTDPKTFVEMMTLVDVAKPDEIQESNLGEKKTIITELSDEKYDEAEKAYFSTLAGLSDKEREEFLNRIKNISPEQKEDIVSRLVRK